ncbi:carbohydrate kinase family protein [Nocardia transvalensis]|uniref:carbohydrate kinase family protein n=1 Tax=Nocardia transvalensis TaxID=37333 RepID=UPI001E6364AF|nr:hypothetical protein [Nocardia transvalensis]
MTDAELSIAADAPMVAAVLAALNVPALLIANPLGADDLGRDIERWLQDHHIVMAAPVKSAASTPWITVVADDHHTRTWFAHLRGVLDSLTEVDLSPIARASYVYVDEYQLVEEASVRAIRAARVSGVPLLVNLGGSALSKEVRSEEVFVPAFEVEVRHTHCAGAAFSGGLLYGLRAGSLMQRSMVLGSASGALRCARHHSAPLPTRSELCAMAFSAQCRSA